MAKYIVAIDSFKGCLTSMEANQAAADGIKKKTSDAHVIQLPVSDGGEGWIEAFHSSLGGEILEATVFDPLMRRITAHYLLKDDTAVIEIAQASGLTLLRKEERHQLWHRSVGSRCRSPWLQAHHRGAWRQCH